MEIARSKTEDNFLTMKLETQQQQFDRSDYIEDKKKLSYTFSTQPLETDLKKLLTQVTGKIDLEIITEVKLKVVSGHAGLHRLSDFTPRLKILILDGSCISSFRDLGSSLKSLTTLSVSRCNVKHLDGVSGFRNLEELNVRENFISDPSPCSSVKKLSKLDLTRNQITEVSYFAFLRTCCKLRELQVVENHFSDYKEEIKALLPQLKILDGEEFEDDLQSGEDLSSEDESSTSLSLSVENIDFEETQPLDDGLRIQNVENLGPKISEKDSNSIENDLKILQEEEEENPEKLVFQSHPILSNDSEPANNGVEKTSSSSSSSKLSSGSRVICGNLAVSLRTRNPPKIPHQLE